MYSRKQWYEAPGAVRTGTGGHWYSTGRQKSQQELVSIDNNYYNNPKLLHGNKLENGRTFKLLLISHKNTKKVQWRCLRNIQTFIFTISWEREEF